MISWRPVRFALTALILAAIGLQQSPATASDAAQLLERMEAARPAWLPDPNKCPADVMSAREAAIDYSKEHCASAPDQCVSHCQAGDANDCYAAALILEEVRDGPVSDALFLRACALGVVSGCTNRAARMETADGNACAIRTYEMACDRNDPWACTMLGFHLVRGIGIAKDHARARQVMSKSCQFGETDPACEYAKHLMREIGD